MSDYLQTADVWTLLDLIVAEWTSDPTSVQCFDLRIVERAKVLVEARRRQQEAGLASGADPLFAELGDALYVWLASKGWEALVLSDPTIRVNLARAEGVGPLARVGHYQFSVNFTGGKRRTSPPATIIVPPGGVSH